MRNKTLEQNSAQSLAGLQVDLLQKLRDGNMSFKQLEWFKNLTFEEREELINKLAEAKYQKTKLITKGIEIPELTEEFSPKKYFAQRKNGKRCFGYDYYFEKLVLDLSHKVLSLPAMSFDMYGFNKAVYDEEEVIDHSYISLSNGFMIREEILRVIAYLTSKQPNGEEGILRTNGYSTIIGYMMESNHVVIPIHVIWEKDYSRWYCNTDGRTPFIDNPYILSRNKLCKQ